MDDKENFEKTKITYGLVLRTDLDTVQKIKEAISNYVDEADYLYQRTYAGKLHIERGGVEE